jgi:hypothetical protein
VSGTVGRAESSLSIVMFQLRNRLGERKEACCRISSFGVGFDSIQSSHDILS